jgi:hypothetical protein
VVSLQSATDQLQEPHTSPGTTFWVCVEPSKLYYKAF